MSREVSTRLGMKDIIVASVLGVVCIAIRFLFMILGGIIPMAWFASHMLGALVMGPVFMLIVTKTKTTGPIFIISVITGIIFITSSVSIIISEIIGGILAEVMLRIGGFRKKFWIMMGYIFFSFGFIGDFYQLWFNKEAFLEYSAKFMNQDYLNALSSVVSTQSAVLIILSIFVGAIIGGLFGFKLMRKHFVKVGIAR
ncbi:MptD family putative ECF transporter S component [Cellulosilyticum ruminicola]|uniref:MptD family putative ECF transporter S component n=1 Tax=Cellulosilyticum ruminicola TaxID=425254 RepID=UPI0006D0C610|nr:MptD family putative ECF transporter S component [Cellulosilyticum ruminicola]